MKTDNQLKLEIIKEIHGNRGNGVEFSKEMADLFLSLLHTERKELIKKVEDKKRAFANDICDLGSEFSTPRDYRDDGYNRALEDVVALLKSTIEEK